MNKKRYFFTYGSLLIPGQPGFKQSRVFKVGYCVFNRYQFFYSGPNQRRGRLAMALWKRFWFRDPHNASYNFNAAPQASL